MINHTHHVNPSSAGIATGAQAAVNYLVTSHPFGHHCSASLLLPRRQPGLRRFRRFAARAGARHVSCARRRRRDWRSQLSATRQTACLSPRAAHTSAAEPDRHSYDVAYSGKPTDASNSCYSSPAAPIHIVNGAAGNREGDGGVPSCIKGDYPRT
jgi:hypothetical protein